MTTTTTHPYVVAVQEAFEEAEAGDPTKLVDLFAEDFQVAAWDLKGGQRLLNKGEYLQAMGIVLKLDECKTSVVDARMIGEDIVAATCRCYRRLGENETTTDILIAFRFTDGKVTRSAEVCSIAFEKFWAGTGITE